MRNQAATAGAGATSRAPSGGDSKISAGGSFGQFPFLSNNICLKSSVHKALLLRCLLLQSAFLLRGWLRRNNNEGGRLKHRERRGETSLKGFWARGAGWFCSTDSGLTALYYAGENECPKLPILDRTRP